MSESSHCLRTEVWCALGASDADCALSVIEKRGPCDDKLKDGICAMGGSVQRDTAVRFSRPKLRKIGRLRS